MDVRLEEFDDLASELGEKSFAFADVWVELHSHRVATDHTAQRSSVWRRLAGLRICLPIAEDGIATLAKRHADGVDDDLRGPHVDTAHFVLVADDPASDDFRLRGC